MASDAEFTPASPLLPILAITSANYSRVFAFWQSSLDELEYPEEQRHVRDLGELSPPFGYCTESWRFAIDQQLTEVVAWIRDHQGEYFLHTDTDIQFFPRMLTVQGEWLQWMQVEAIDMLFMRERTHFMPQLREGEVNAGFYVVHCNPRTLEFWQQVLAWELEYPKMDGYPPYTDQYHLNRALCYRAGVHPQVGEFGIRWSVIPDEHCIWSLPDSDLELTSAAFHHAVNTQDKVELLRRVRAKVLARQPLPRQFRRWNSWAARLRAVSGRLTALREAPLDAARTQRLKTAADALASLLGALAPGSAEASEAEDAPAKGPNLPPNGAAVGESWESAS